MSVLIHDRRETADLTLELNDVVRTDETPSGDIVVSHVEFAYRSAPEVSVLSDLSLTIGNGLSVALVGGSGAGKSTLVDLILGLHRPLAGQVAVGGVDIWDNLPAWQAQLAVVPQDVFLLDATLGENITFDLEMDPDRLHLALERAQLMDLVATWMRASTRASASEACVSPADSASGSGSHERCIATQAFLFSTRRPRLSTTRLNRV